MSVFFSFPSKMPTMVHAGVYSAVTHYLKAVAATNTLDAATVSAKMHELKISDAILDNAEIRQDGRIMRPFYLFEVKAPSESKGPWDFYKLVATVPGDQAFTPLSESKCALLKK